MAIDITKMIGNISQALLPVQALITGLAYLVGVLFMIHAIQKLKAIGGAKNSNEKMFVPIAYFLGGTALIFLPTALEVTVNTTFGTGSANAIQYTEYNPYNIYSAMKVLIQTAGVIWFFRGCILLAHASEPGVQDGPKGLTFLVAGVFAMNFEGTISALNYSLSHLITCLTG